MTIKEHFFISTLVVFNETFASLKGDVDYVLLWHEGTTGRRATDVASSYIKCINLCGKSHVTIWGDNCSAQNKNWWLFSALCWCVNQPWGPQSMTIKYLERGHTFMRADCVHGSIGKRMKKTPEINNFEDFVDICDKSSSLIKPVVLHHTEFYKFPEIHRARTSKKVKLPKLCDISVAKFVKGSKELSYKREFDGEEESVAFLKLKADLTKEVPVMEAPRGIHSNKKTGIIKLIQSLPPAKQKFWHELGVNDESTDLVSSFE